MKQRSSRFLPLRWAAFAAFLGLAAPQAGLEAAGYRFLLPTVEARPGDSVRITVKGEHEASAQGFSFAARYPASSLTIERVHLEDTILEAIDVDFFEAKILPAQGILVIGVLVDSEAPFDGNLIPNIGRPLEFFHIEAKVGAAAEGDLEIRLENGLADPPIENVYAVANQSVAVTELGKGVVRLPGAGGGGGSFFRGDFNLDSGRDITDPIGILEYIFSGGAAPRCLAAADVNDDDKVDISDPVFLLMYLFNRGAEPPPPSVEAGPDPTPGVLGCEEPSDPVP